MNRLLILSLLLVASACRNKDDDTGGAVDLCTWYADADGDGYGDAADSSTASCDEQPGGTVDNGDDCDDAVAEVFPGAEESCDAVDNDCDGEVDEDASDAVDWYADVDGDGYGDPGSTLAACDAPSGYLDDAQDCDDSDAAVFPGAEEQCNGVDDDCDGEIDEDASLETRTFYIDADGDGYGDPEATIEACAAPSGAVELAYATDCDDEDAAIHPAAEETCDGVDNDCDEEIDEQVTSTFWADSDGDGYGDALSPQAACALEAGLADDDTDCDDGDADIHPGAAELCNGVDDDCDDEIDEDDAVDASTWYADADADGFGSATVSTTACEAPRGYGTDTSDCDDFNDTIHPGADELCDAVDNDCDGAVDEDDAIDASAWYTDLDGDGYGDASSASTACTAPSGAVDNSEDCDDGDAAVNPGADEACNGVDDDCDGAVDEAAAIDAGTWYADMDGDGYGDLASTQRACEQPSGAVADSSDCDDGDAAIHPAAEELCDSVDNDCDGTVDEDSAADAPSWYSDADGDGYGDAASAQRACSQPSGTVADSSDCNDGDASVNPDTLWYLDHDSDGFGDAAFALASCTQPTRYVADATDCDDLDSAVYPGASEICDGLDQDCDGDVDEGYPTGMQTWYADSDLDGYGDASVTTEACTEPSGYVDDASDCDDGNADVNPDAEELCNGVDDDCDGAVDPDSLNYGDGELCAAISCEDILAERPGATDGAYWLDPEADGGAFEAWCEMDLLGGGWLAVYNMMERAGNSTEAANMHASLIVNDDMTEAILPDSTSDAIHTANLPLADYSEVLYGWAPSDGDDVTRYGTYTDSGGLVGECYIDGYCGAGVAVSTFQIEPTGSSITIYTGNSPTYPHVGLGWSGQIICWGYDNNASSYGHWANWYDTKSCCTSGNTSDITTPGWRYVIYIR
jgi:hypothetical protein